jgi:ribosomal protein S4
LFTINGNVVTIPSQLLKVNDTIKPISFDKIQPKEGFVLPDWLKANVKEKSVQYTDMPKLDSFQEKFDLQAIIEYYSR